MNISKLTVGKRLGVGFGAVLLMLMGLMVLAIFQLGELNAETEKIVTKDWVKARLAVGAIDNARGSIARMFQLTSEQTPEEAPKTRDRLAANTALTAKWQMTQDAALKMVRLEVAVQKRTVELRTANEALRLAATELQDAHEKLKHQATHDALTGLPNRSLLHDRLEQAISYADRYKRLLTVVFMDLDYFKSINDTLGHQAGDDLLKVIAERMANCVRSVDSVVRLGGDEFVIVLFDQPEKGGPIIPTLERLREAIARPIQIGSQTLQITVSMGLATYPIEGTGVSALQMNADAAMYRAKALGRNNYQFYTAEMNTKA